MKKLSLIALTAILASAATPATAGFYGSLGVGTTVDTEIENASGELSIDSDMGYAIAVGYEVPLLPLRVEVESFAMRSQGGDNSTTEHTVDGLMLNAYAGLPIPIVQPYIGAGFGEAKSGYSDDTSSMSTGYHSAWQAMIGAELSLPLLPFSVGLEYRYLNTEDKASFETNVQSVLVKARLQF